MKKIMMLSIASAMLLGACQFQQTSEVSKTSEVSEAYAEGWIDGANAVTQTLVTGYNYDTIVAAFYRDSTAFADSLGK